MGVYLPNMEMPIDCIKCPFCLFADGHWKCLVDGSHADFGGTCRPQRCPLVPVQQHGRLIDADALKDVQQADADFFKGSSDYGEKCRYDEAINAVANIVNAPTIIPAEEGET